MESARVVLAIALFYFLPCGTAYAQRSEPSPGKPFEVLIQRITELEQRIDELSAHVAAPVTVVDATGMTIGPVVGYGPQTAFPPTAIVAVRYADRVFPVAVDRDGFRTPHTGGLFFETTDCSGQAFIPLSHSGSVYPFVAIDPDGTLLIEEAGVIPQQRLLRSQTPGLGSGLCYASSHQSTAIPVSPLVNLTSIFVAPYSVIVP